MLPLATPLNLRPTHDPVLAPSPITLCPISAPCSQTLSPCGSFFFTGTRSGGLHCWQPAAREAEPPAAAEIEQPPCGTDDQQQQRNQQQHQEQPQRTPQQNPSQGQQQQQVNQQQQRLLQQEARVLAMWDSNQPLVNEQVDFQGLGLGVALEGLNFLKGERFVLAGRMAMERGQGHPMEHHYS